MHILDAKLNMFHTKIYGVSTSVNMELCKQTLMRMKKVKLETLTEIFQKKKSFGKKKYRISIMRRSIMRRKLDSSCSSYLLKGLENIPPDLDLDNGERFNPLLKLEKLE